jgi:hypothetical protein
MIERPVDFSYETCWVECPACDERVVVSIEARKVGQEVSCSRGHPFESGDVDPVVTDLADLEEPAGDVGRVAWYHTSTRRTWPPTDDAPTAIATHVGTFEAAIENMLRRMHDQDDAREQFYLHRVRLTCGPAEISSIGTELEGFYGNVRLRVLYALGSRIARYVNLYEQQGGVSLAIEPSVVAEVQTIKIPLAEGDEREQTQTMFAQYRTEENSIQARRPRTDGLDQHELIKPTTERSRQIVRQLRDCNKASTQNTSTYRTAMRALMMPSVGEPAY